MLDNDDVKNELNRLQEKYVFVPTDKASNNISVVCKQFYIKTMLNELCVFEESDENESSTYKKYSIDPTKVIHDHKKKMKEWGSKFKKLFD